jgi:hypothetical protein
MHHNCRTLVDPKTKQFRMLLNNSTRSCSRLPGFKCWSMAEFVSNPNPFWWFPMMIRLSPSGMPGFPESPRTRNDACIEAPAKPGRSCSLAQGTICATLSAVSHTMENTE